MYSLHIMHSAYSPEPLEIPPQNFCHDCTVIQKLFTYKIKEFETALFEIFKINFEIFMHDEIL